MEHIDGRMLPSGSTRSNSSSNSEAERLFPASAPRSDDAAAARPPPPPHDKPPTTSATDALPSARELKGGRAQVEDESSLIHVAHSQALLEGAINIAERITGYDLDGDGDIGETGTFKKQKRLNSLVDVLNAAIKADKPQFFLEERVQTEQDAELSRRYWLSNSLLLRAVVLRSGADSWEAKVARFLQSKGVQVLLIALLLMDVLIVFAELFLETEYPGCKVMRKATYSCCPAEASGGAAAAAAGAAASAATAADGHRALGSYEEDDGSPTTVVESIVTVLLGAVPHHAPGIHMCHAGEVAMISDEIEAVVASTGGGLSQGNAYRVGCTIEPWSHSLHELFSLCTLLILFFFQVEIMGLMASFRGFFFRSRGYLIDLLVVSLSLALQWYVLMVEIGIKDPLGLTKSADHAAHEELEDQRVATLEELQSIILFARCWRFIRVGHGIATSMHDMVHQSKAQMKLAIDELRAALRELEADIPTKARGKLEDVNEKLKALTGEVNH